MTRQPVYFEMANDNRFWSVTQHVLLVLPWLWLGLFALLIMGAVGQQGSWPSYGQPDPKAIASLGALVTPLILLMMITLAGLPFGFLFTTFAIWKGAPYSINKKHAVLYLLGVFLFLAIVIGNAAGLMTWLMD